MTVAEKIELQTAVKRVCERHNTSSNHLQFIGKRHHQECSMTLWYFNITDANHPRFKSTVVHSVTI